MEINYLTGKVMESIRFNGRKNLLAQSKDVTDLKKRWLRMFYKPGQEIPPGFIKGAKLINFEVIFAYVKS